MNKRTVMRRKAVLLFSSITVFSIQAQVTTADYERANGLRKKYDGLAVNVAGPATWIGDTHRFWYRKSVRGGNEFELYDADSQSKRPAFDHQRLAESLSAAADEKYTAVTLPFFEFSFADHDAAIEFVAANSSWKCQLSDYSCKKTGPPPPGFQFRRPPSDDDNESPVEPDGDAVDGMVYLSPQQGQNRAGGRGQGAEEATVKASPDGKLEAVIENFNVFIRPKGNADAAWQLSWDGSEGNYYTIRSVAWSPDSKRLAAYRVHPGYRREVHYIESSPKGQLQPKHSTMVYAKPGDVLDAAQPMLFEIASKKQVVVDRALFPNPYNLSNPVWWKDSRGFTFEYNQRGHQLYRVIEVKADTGEARSLISEESSAFIDSARSFPISGTP